VFSVGAKPKMIKNIIVGFLLVFIIPHAHAYKLKYYQCPNKRSSLSCSGNCILLGSIEFEFVKKIDVQEIKYIVKDQNNSSSYILKNCIVENIRNWSCSSNEIFSSTNFNMIEGKYYSLSTYRMLDGKDDERFSCAIN
jgi:hypothetical protein